MKIFGIGTDIVKVNRISKSIKSKSFVSRLFNKEEIIKCKKITKTSNCFAKRYAAKEAFSKALGTGISNGIKFNEIVVSNDTNGKPFIKLLKKTKKIVNKKIGKTKYKIALSLTDEDQYAVAFVTISI